MAYAREYEKELLDRPVRRRMEVPGAPSPGSEQARTTEGPRRPRGTRYDLLRAQERLPTRPGWDEKTGRREPAGASAGSGTAETARRQTPTTKAKPAFWKPLSARFTALDQDEARQTESTSRDLSPSAQGGSSTQYRRRAVYCCQGARDIRPEPLDFPPFAGISPARSAGLEPATS